MEEGRSGGVAMGMDRTFGWLEVRRIAEELAERHPSVDPLGVRFVELRRMVEALPGFREEPGHPVNEKILETIQMHWVEEREDGGGEEEGEETGEGE
jgi:FeS assembly protein IscX